MTCIGEYVVVHATCFASPAEALLSADKTFGYVESAARTAEDRMRKWLTERLPRA